MKQSSIVESTDVNYNREFAVITYLEDLKSMMIVWVVAWKQWRMLIHILCKGLLAHDGSFAIGFEVQLE